MQKKILFFILGFATIACTEKIYITSPPIIKTTVKTDTIVVGNVGQTVNIRVDWSKFTASSIMSKYNDGNNLYSPNMQISLIGSRLIYPKEKAVFTQTAEKTSVDTQPQLITLQVPPTDTAHLYVVAVARDCPDDCGRLFVMKFGVKRNIKIFPNTTINLTLDSLTLTNATWVIDSMETGYSVLDDTIYTSRVTSDGTTYNHFKIRVTDPFENNGHQATIVGFQGIGRNTTSVVNSMRLMTMDLNSRLTIFWPGISGYLFGFNSPSTNLLIGKKGVIITTFTP